MALAADQRPNVIYIIDDELGYYEPGEDWASNVVPATAPPMGTAPGTHA